MLAQETSTLSVRVSSTAASSSASTWLTEACMASSESASLAASGLWVAVSWACGLVAAVAGVQGDEVMLVQGRWTIAEMLLGGRRTGRGVDLMHR